MKKTTTVLAALFLSCCGIQAQGGKSASMTFQRPRLVVGIVIDQMRWDYLYRYQQRYTEGGFKRLLTEGYSCENPSAIYPVGYGNRTHLHLYGQCADHTRHCRQQFL